MPEQPQWRERTLDMPPQDPWAEPPTAPTPTTPFGGPVARPAPTTPFTGPAGGSAPVPAKPAAPPSPFSQGRARVNPRTEPFAHQHGAHEQTAHDQVGHDWHGAQPREPRSLAWHISRLRRGGEWSSAAVLFAFVCWGVWAISSDGPLGTPIIVFLVSLLVAAGVFALARLVGRVVLERQMGRVRHTARGAHIVTAVFLAGVGLAHLRQTEWVMDAVNWIKGLFG